MAVKSSGFKWHQGIGTLHQLVMFYFLKLFTRWAILSIFRYYKVALRTVFTSPWPLLFLVFDFQERRLKTNRSSSTSPCQLLALQEFNQVWPRSFHEKGILYCKHKSNLFCGSFAVTPGQPPPQPQYRDVPVSWVYSVSNIFGLSFIQWLSLT